MVFADDFRIVFLCICQACKLPAEVCRNEHIRTASSQAGGGKGNNKICHNSKGF